MIISLKEPVYRVAEKEWKDFVESFTDVLTEVDSQIPHLPPKDLIHRIYRDVSNSTSFDEIGYSYMDVGSLQQRQNPVQEKFIRELFQERTQRDIRWL